MEYSHSSEAALIAAELIPKHHEHLRLVRIEYVFADGVIKSKGKELLGRAKKKSGLDAFLAANSDEDEPQPFFVIEISKPAWDLLDKKQKLALVDHELCHCLWDVDKGIYMRAHDVEEFSEIIKRHGLWEPGVELFATIAAKHVKQMDLPIPAKEQVRVLKGNGKEESTMKEIVGKANETQDKLPDFKKDVEQKRRGARASH